MNLDKHPLPGVDIVHDLTDLPLPFENESVDEVLCRHVLEHIDYIPVLRDIHRILTPGGRLCIYVPHFTSSAMYDDPTHRHFFSAATFGFFTQQAGRDYYFDFAFSRIASLKIRFARRRLFFYNNLVERLVNRSSAMQAIYESSPLRIFPASEIEVELVK